MMAKYKRWDAQYRYEHVLKAAMTVAVCDGWSVMRRADIADEAGVSPGTVSRYLGDRKHMLDLVMREAVARKILRVIAQGIAQQHPATKGLSARVRNAAIRSVTE